MFLERRYIGVCSKCTHDVFLEIYTHKLDLVQSCECIDNQIVKQSWWETYIFKPLWFKMSIFPGMLLLLGWKLSHAVTLLAIIVFCFWIDSRVIGRIQNKVATKWLEQPTHNNW